MTIATQPDFKTGKIKYRPCIDLSHHVNKYIVDTPTSISHLSAVEDMLLEGDYQTVYDLENMYFNIVVTPEQRKFLGCEIEDPEMVGMTDIVVYHRRINDFSDDLPLSFSFSFCSKGYLLSVRFLLL